MSGDVYHEMFFHLIWHAKESRPLIYAEREKELYQFIQQRALQPGGVYVHEIGGTENHVHLVVRVNPNLPIPDWIGKVKGGSSHDHNKRFENKGVLAWQNGYGIIGFGMNDLPWVLQYVQNQKEHHRKGTIFDRLERTEPEEGGGA